VKDPKKISVPREIGFLGKHGNCVCYNVRRGHATRLIYEVDSPSKWPVFQEKDGAIGRYYVHIRELDFVSRNIKTRREGPRGMFVAEKIDVLAK